MGRKLRKRPRTDPEACRRRAHSGQGPSRRLRSGRLDPAGRAGPEPQNLHPPTKPPAPSAPGRGPAIPDAPPPSAPTPAAGEPWEEPATPAAASNDPTSRRRSNPPRHPNSRGALSPCAHSNPKPAPPTSPHRPEATGLHPLPLPVRTRSTTAPAGLRSSVRMSWKFSRSWKFSVFRFKPDKAFAAWGHAAYNPQPCRPGALTRRCPCFAAWGTRPTALNSGGRVPSPGAAPWASNLNLQT